MKDNFSVINGERVLKETVSVVFKTDLEGVITYVNKAFIDISGFGMEELIGVSHNIVCHPDMPEVVFQHMWATLRTGKPWQGIIKNRCKDGAYYWVVTNVIPLYEDNRIASYMSFGLKPTQQQIEAAVRFYQEINEHGEYGIKLKGVV